MDEHVRAWLAGYLDAWRSNDAGAVGALFTSDATYRFDPADDPITGREAIVAAWLDAKDQPGTWTAQVEPLVVTDEVAIISGTVDYTSGKRYSNLWVLRLDRDGAATDFTEWYMPRTT